MKTRNLLKTLTVLGLITLAMPAEATTITLLPTAALTASPGETVGWGFELEGDASLDVFVNGSLTPLPVTQGILSLINLPFALAGTTVTEAYDPFALPFPLGLFEIALAPTATLGLLSGTFSGVFEFYDPATFDLVRTEAFSVPFSVTVTADADATVPEPSTLVLLGAGLGVTMLGRGVRPGSNRGQTGVRPPWV